MSLNYKLLHRYLRAGLLLVFNVTKLVLPALIPSWRFFDEIAPSPRIEIRLFTSMNTHSEWYDFRPVPNKLSALHFITRLFWNPVRNETLYMFHCADKYIQSSDPYFKDEINRRIQHELERTAQINAYWQYRIVYLYRQHNKIQSWVGYTSELSRHKRLHSHNPIQSAHQ